MKIFMAIDDAETVPMFYEKTGIKLNYLISYYYLGGQAYKLTEKYRHMIDLLFLDSGAYSVWTGQSKITITEYLRFLKLYGDRFDAYFNLDDDFDDPDHNQWNQQYLEEQLPPGAKKPVPVVHSKTDPFGEFEFYAQMGHDFIAIGSTTKIPSAVFDKIKNTYPNIRVHMFGNLDRKILRDHTPYSADATTWADVAGIGDILYYDPDERREYPQISTGGKEVKDPTSVHFKKFKHRQKLEEFLKNTFQFTYEDLLPRHGPRARQIINLYFFKQLEDHINSTLSS
jgi:hypothetical protein